MTASLYRITRTDPRSSKPQVKYGTGARVAALVRTARETNDSRDHIREWLESDPERHGHLAGGPENYQHVTMLIERAVITDFEDVTDEFIKP